jgi:hypothetical protein
MNEDIHTSGFSAYVQQQAAPRQKAQHLADFDNSVPAYSIAKGANSPSIFKVTNEDYTSKETFADRSHSAE